jgi:hypothetical protein
MAEKQTITVKMDITPEIRALLKTLNEMDKESKTDLKEKVKGIAGWVAQDIKRAAVHAPMARQATQVANTVRANKDRVPAVTIGGARKAKVTRKVTETNPAPSVGALLFGSEFGGPSEFPNGGRRFPYRSPQRGQGNEGYWIYPTLRSNQPRITREWHEACDEVLSNWTKGVSI